jgi:hypothetical protein
LEQFIPVLVAIHEGSNFDALSNSGGSPRSAALQPGWVIRKSRGALSNRLMQALLRWPVLSVKKAAQLVRQRLLRKSKPRQKLTGSTYRHGREPMEQTFNPVLRSIGRILRDRDEDIAKQALPERWVELIGRLDDKAKMVCGQRISQSVATHDLSKQNSGARHKPPSGAIEDV